MKTVKTLEVGQFGPAEILNSLCDGAYITDTERRIVFWNQAAERITGWSAAEVVGQSCFSNILAHLDKDGNPLCGKENCPLHRSIVTRRSSDAPQLVFAKTKAGTRVPVEVTVSPLVDGEGRVIGGVEMFRDASDALAEMTRAHIIQQNALRCDVPEDARLAVSTCYRPRDLVGGDFYQIEHLDGPRYVILVADVMGHGVSSALHTMQLHALWEDLRDECAHPALVFTSINRSVRAMAPDEGYFATALCVVVDVETGRLTYAQAGHPPPLLLHADGVISQLEAGQPALGLVDRFQFKEQEGVLGPGERLLAFTDGAVEINNMRDEELGFSGLGEIWRDVAADRPLGPEGMIRFQESLLAYSGCIHLPDDLTLIEVARR